MQAGEVAARRGPAVRRSARAKGGTGALRIVVSAFGAVVAFAGVEHGIGEILQGPVAPGSLAIESWPRAKAFEILAGEPAMTVIPNLVVAGVVTVIVALALGLWSIAFVERRCGAPVLIGLSVLLLLVGGGFAPPLIGIVLGFAATRLGGGSRRSPRRVARAVARTWPWALGAGMVGYLGLVPGIPLLVWLFGVSDANLVLALGVIAFGGLLLSLIAARAQDRLAMARSSGWPTERSCS